MSKKQISLFIKLAATLVAIGAAVCLVVVYSTEILTFLNGAKEKVKSKIPSSKFCCCDDEASDFADI